MLTALIVSASGGTDPAQLQRWAEEVQQIDDVEPTGLGGLMRWLALAWRGDFPASIEVCVAASLDGRLRQATRDMFVGIAVLDHFSLTDATSDTHGLIPRALEVADRSDVALHRATCVLGAAWGLAGTDPDRSLQLVRRAIRDVPERPRADPPDPAGQRRPAAHSPRSAGRRTGLAGPTRRDAVAFVVRRPDPALLRGDLARRPRQTGAAEQALITVTSAPTTPHQSMMDFVDLARRAASASSPASIAELETTVRAALAEIADAS